MEAGLACGPNMHIRHTLEATSPAPASMLNFCNKFELVTIQELANPLVAKSWTHVMTGVPKHWRRAPNQKSPCCHPSLGGNNPVTFIMYPDKSGFGRQVRYDCPALSVDDTGGVLSPGLEIIVDC